jgi:hypothetical protein
VPCRCGGWYPAGSIPAVSSGPVVTEPVRSGTEPSTPVSSTATVTPFPRVTGQAWGALIATSCGCSADRMLRTSMAGPELAGVAARPGRVSSPAVASRARAIRPVSTTTPGGDR